MDLLNNVDKELNNYMIQLREWYGWHFPELSKIITDNLTYARTVNFIGNRIKTSEIDLSEILTEDVEKKVKEAAEVSMGTEINEKDEKFIVSLANQIIELYEYREKLSEFDK